MKNISIRAIFQKLNRNVPFKITVLMVVVFSFVFHASLIAQNNPYELKIGHPRLIMTKYNELALRFILMEDPLAQRLRNELKKDADQLLGSKKIKYSLDRRQTMLSISREYLKRIITLSLAYRIFEQDKYSDEAIDQMLYACSYPDWNPQHFLDVAEMTAAMAIGYDWNFYHMNLREQETIRNKIVEFGLNPGLDVYNNPEDKPHVWYKMNNNWNQVCAGGLVLGALAVGEDFPDLKNNIIYQAVKNLIPTLDLYEPEGVWYEGPAYWDYANSYLAMMFSSMQTALEHDFGLSDRQGVTKTSEFYINTISPTGKVFNFADAESAEPPLSSALFWFSKRYKQKDVADYYKNLLENRLKTVGDSRSKDRLFYLSIPWFNDEPSEPLVKPKAQYFRGMVDLLFFQSTDDKQSIYLAAKGGKGTLNHQQLDAGSFVVDADGERWGMDLGSENYFLPDFFENEVNGGRWQYYRNTNKSHNTLVIGDQIQYPDGEAKVVEFKDNISQLYGIIDLSAVYLEARRVRRGYKMLNEDQVLIRDEIDFSTNASTVQWGMMTDASIELSGDKAILTKNGKNFYLQVFAKEEVTFEYAAAKAYHKEAKDNAGINKLFFTVNKSGENEHVEISVVMGRQLNGLNSVIVNSKLDSW